MKTSVLTYSGFSNVINVGDYVQSLAAKQYFDRTPGFINREYLNEYNGEETKLIMNGWFTHLKENWPPSKNIKPLYVSFHLNSTAYSILEKQEAIDHFKKHEPIGCRDYKTKEVLEAKGIKAYFTGCLTLTLGRTYRSEESSDKVYFADPYFEFSKKPADLLTAGLFLLLNYSLVSLVLSKKHQHKSFLNLLKNASFVKQYSSIFPKELIKNAEYRIHSLPEDYYESEEEWFAHAESFLKDYSKAALVITSRIHSALPSLGMGTKVLYIDNTGEGEMSSCRFKGIKNLFNVISYTKGKFSSPDLDLKKGFYKSFKNKKDYEPLAEELISTCERFAK